MHEMSLVRSLLKQVSGLVASGDGDLLREVRVQVGPLSGVEPVLMAAAWERLSVEANFDGATLEIEHVPLVARCDECGRTFQPIRFSFYCPGCGGTRTETLSGDGVILHSIVVGDKKQGATL